MLRRALLGIAMIAAVVLVGCGGGEKEGAVGGSSAASGEAAAYIAGAVSVTTTLTSVSNNTVDLMNEVMENPAVLGGEAWFRDLAREQSHLNEAQSKLLSLEPPTQFSEAHRLLTQAVAEQVTGLGLLETGSRNMDADSIKEATGHFQEGNRLLRASMDALPQQ